MVQSIDLGPVDTVRMDWSRTVGSIRIRAQARRHGGPVRSLRSRWRRAFALLAVVVMLSGTASIVGIQLVVDSFRGSAVATEREATASADLRNEIVAGSITLASPSTAAQQTEQAATVASIKADYEADLLKMKSPAARSLLAASLVKWNALVAATGPAGHPADLATRGIAVAAQAPAVLSLLDQAGTVNRAAIRVDLAHASRLDREGLAALIIIEFLAIALALRLAHQLSNEVLRPVGILRDSANRLARGEVDHRVVVGRADELGELASSFNAMADAIAVTLPPPLVPLGLLSPDVVSTTDDRASTGPQSRARSPTHACARRRRARENRRMCRGRDARHRGRLGNTNRIYAAGIIGGSIQRVVTPFAVGMPNRVDGRKIQHVETHRADGRQPRDHVAERAVPRFVLRLGPRKQFVPAREIRAGAFGIYGKRRTVNQKAARLDPAHCLQRFRREQDNGIGRRHAESVANKRLAFTKIQSDVASGIALFCKVAREAAVMIDPGFDGEFVPTYPIQR